MNEILTEPINFQQTKHLELFIEDHKREQEGFPLKQDAIHAADQLISHLKQYPAARLGTVLNRSPRNLIWVMKEILTPLFNKFSKERKLDISNVLSSFERKSSFDVVDNASRKLKAIALNSGLDWCSGDVRFLNFIRDIFEYLLKGFRPKEDMQSGYIRYCPYCYRYAQPGGDTCHVHVGSNRPRNKSIQERCDRLHRLIRSGGYFEDQSHNVLTILPLTLGKFQSVQIPYWANLHQSQHKDWVLTVLRTFDFCNEWQIDRIAEFLLKNRIDLREKYTGYRDKYEEYGYWPAFFRFDFFCYEVYKLAEHKALNQKLSNLLHLAWSDMEVKEISVLSGVSKEYIYRQIAKWEKKINELRLMGVKEEVIKLTFDLEVLPARKV